MVERLDHTAVTLSFIEGFNEVVLFGGDSSSTDAISVVNKTRIIRFGKCDINVEQCYLIYKDNEFHMKKFCLFPCTYVNTLF